MSGRCLEVVWKVSGNCLEGVWKLSGWCLNDKNVSKRLIDGVQRIFCRHFTGYMKVFC